MAQHPLEMVLLRQLASYLAVPIWITDAAGNLVFYNEPAEQMLGMSFEDAGPINAERLPELFKATGPAGEVIDPAELPVRRALRTRSPAHARLRIFSLDGVAREIEVTAIAITAQGDRFLGVMVAFWEPKD